MSYDKLVGALKHLPGGHDQSSHAGSGPGKWSHGVPLHFAQQSADTLAEKLADMIGDNARATDVKNGKSKISLFIPEKPKVNKVNEYVGTNRKKYGIKTHDITPSDKKNYYDLTIDFGKVDVPED